MCLIRRCARASVSVKETFELGLPTELYIGVKYRSVTQPKVTLITLHTWSNEYVPHEIPTIEVKLVDPVLSHTLLTTRV